MRSNEGNNSNYNKVQLLNLWVEYIQVFKSF